MATSIETEHQQDLTQLIDLWRTGDKQAGNQLFESVYCIMRSKAAYAMRSSRPDDSMSPTLLVHEAYVSLSKTISRGRFSVHDRRHFLKLTSRVMRNLVVDHARARRAQNRGNGMDRVPWSDSLIGASDNPEQIIAVATALEKLAETHPESARLAELRFFTGMSESEIAEVMEMSPRSVRRHWSVAKTRLFEILHGPINN